MTVDDTPVWHIAMPQEGESIPLDPAFMRYPPNMVAICGGSTNGLLMVPPYDLRCYEAFATLHQDYEITKLLALIRLIIPVSVKRDPGYSG